MGWADFPGTLESMTSRLLVIPIYSDQSSHFVPGEPPQHIPFQTAGTSDGKVCRQRHSRA